MSCFSHFRVFFWVVVVKVGGGGAHAFLPTIVGYAMRGGGRKITHEIIGGGGGASKNCKGNKSKIIIAPPLHKLWTLPKQEKEFYVQNLEQIDYIYQSAKFYHIIYFNFYIVCPVTKLLIKFFSSSTVNCMWRFHKVSLHVPLVTTLIRTRRSGAIMLPSLFSV